MIVFDPVKTERKSAEFNLAGLVDRLVGAKLEEGDVLVISSKFMAISEGRVVELSSVKVSKNARVLSRKYNVPNELCELIIRESDEIIGGVTGFILSTKDGLLAPNAGIDKSNIEYGKVVLYPRKPFESAQSIVDALKFSRGVNIGVVVSDSRLMPTRRGTTGVAVAAAGIEAVVDLRGRYDLFGNVLRVTSQAIADDICSGAQLVMGESDESMPIVLVKGLKRLLKKAEYPSEKFSISTNQCVYMRSLGYKPRRRGLPAS